MRRNLEVFLAVSLMMVACNSITGTQPPTPPTVNVPIKNCIDDFRAVNILQPAMQSRMRIVNDTFDVIWEVEEFCSDWYARVEMSYDNGTTWFCCGNSLCNACSLRVHMVPRGSIPADTPLLVKVCVRDVIGEVCDEHAFTVVSQGQRRRVPQQRD